MHTPSTTCTRSTIRAIKCIILISGDSAPRSSVIYTLFTYPVYSSKSYLLKGPSIHHMNLFYPCSFASFSGTHCGYILPPLVVSASNSISVNFQSDSRLTDRGFSAEFEAVYPEDIAGSMTETPSQLREEVVEAPQCLVNQS